MRNIVRFSLGVKHKGSKVRKRISTRRQIGYLVIDTQVLTDLGYRSVDHRCLANISLAFFKHSGSNSDKLSGGLLKVFLPRGWFVRVSV